jgi:ABC-type oligopeptide transport system substrate-binding subunit
MFKRIIAATLCLIMAVTAFASCAKKDENDKGAIIHMYLSQEVYDFDPAYAYSNDAALKIVDLLFASLFRVNEKGKLENDLASGYVIDKAHNTLTITIDDEAFWSDGTYVSANDVVYTVKRLLAPESTSEAACLLFDIKNARVVKNATSDAYTDDIGVYAVGEREVEFTFEDGFTDYEGFLYNLASPALAPLPEAIVKINEGDWAKKPSTMICSGPFRLYKISYDPSDKGLTLERNAYYFRELDERVDKAVRPYRIVVDYTKSAAEQYEMFKRGEIFYLGDIALSVRGTLKDVEIQNALSTATVYLNENVCVGKTVRELDKETSSSIEEVKAGVTYITNTYKSYYTYYNYLTDAEYEAKYGKAYEKIPASDKKNADYTVYGQKTETTFETVDGASVVHINVYEEYRYVYTDVTADGKTVSQPAVDAPGGEKLFANKDVRNALSLAIDRDAIAKKIVYAEAATGFVPTGIFGTDYNRKSGFRKDNGALISTKADPTKAQGLIPSSITPANYEIELMVRGNDEVHQAIAEEIAKAWEALGFKVLVNSIYPIVNDDKGSTGTEAKDIRDDLITELYEAGQYSAILVDIVAATPSAYGFLAPFAKEFAGSSVDMNPNDGDVEHLYEVMGHRTGYNSEAYNAKIDEAFKADPAKRAQLLREAEKILMEDMPIIPIIFNQDAYLISKELSKVESTYFGTRIFTDAKLKNYQKYLPQE